MKSLCILWVALGLLCALAASADLPSPDQILAKCLAGYDAAKTYQGAFVLRTEQGKDWTKIAVRVKAENDKKGMIVRSSLTMEVTSTKPAGTRTSRQLFVDDGKTIFTINPDLKQYTERPHAPDRISGLYKRLLDNARKSGGKLSVRAIRRQNRSVYEVKCALNDGVVNIYIDKQTYRLQSFHGERGHDEAKYVSDLTVTDQVFNQPIAANTLAWSPPSDYTKAETKGKEEK